jgi:putative transposase
LNRRWIEYESLLTDISSHVTLWAIRAELAARGTKASYGAIWTFVHAEGLTFKKNRHRRRAAAV